jgi:alpha-beta hydrolase superfamily lysophospholipase
MRVKIQNPFRSRSPKRPTEAEYETFDQYIKAEMDWWEERHRRYVGVTIVVLVTAIGAGIVVAVWTGGVR